MRCGGTTRTLNGREVDGGAIVVVEATRTVLAVGDEHNKTCKQKNSMYSIL